MKLSFSTNGWKETGWDEFCNTAVDLGFNAIELHGVVASAFSAPAGPFHPTALPLRRAGSTSWG